MNDQILLKNHLTCNPCASSCQVLLEIFNRKNLGACIIFEFKHLVGIHDHLSFCVSVFEPTFSIMKN
jgi:hypothetical protein